MKQLGYHPSRVASKVLQKGDTFVLGQMGWIELIQGNYRYHVYFSAKGQEEIIENPPSEKKMKTNDGTAKPIQRCLSSFGFSHKEVNDATFSWREYNSLLVFQNGPSVYSNKIASFDLDNTVIQTASGKKFPSTPTDWKFMTRVVEKLNIFVTEGYRVVILSNQLGISKGKVSKEHFKQKIESVAKKLQISFLLLASTGKDKYRKPCIGMWEHLVKHESGEADIDKKASFYVGDAAGRLDNWMPGNLLSAHKQHCVLN